MGYDQGIANRIRATGLRVVEVAGWQTAGSSSFYPGGSVNHHTAGPSTGSTPSLSTVIYGRSDLPGPLCNVYQSREPDGWDIAYIVAAGRANHAGEGGWYGLEGNSSVYGLEIEHTGVDPMPELRIHIAALIHSAMFPGDPGMVPQHREWAPNRKPDAATNVEGNYFRNLVAAARNPTEPPDPEDPFDMQAPPIVKDDNRPEWWLIESDGRTHITDREWGCSLWWAGMARVADFGDGKPENIVPYPWPKEWIDAVPRKDEPASR